MVFDRSNEASFGIPKNNEMMRMKISKASCLLLLFFYLAGCNKTRQGELPPDTATSGSFELLADETLRPVIDSLVYGFNTQTPNAKVTVRYKNATEALDELIQGRVRLVLIGRPLSTKERQVLANQKIELTEAEVAVNAIGCIVNSKSHLESINMDSLKNLINYELVGNSSRKNFIRVSSSYLSSTEWILDSIFQRSKYQEGEIARYQTTDSIINRVKNLENAIGFVNASWLKKYQNDSSIRILKISGTSDRAIMMHPAYILQGLYPLTSTVCAYTTEVPNTLPRGFLAYAMSSDGQRIFLNYDLLPKTQILKLVPPQ
jgi:phosphate transport system substrate-binding protein